MKTSYDSDVIAWAQEQVNLLRSGQFSLLDIEHIAEEIEDVGKSEQRELASRMAVLLAHLLKSISQILSMVKRTDYVSRFLPGLKKEIGVRTNAVKLRKKSPSPAGEGRGEENKYRKKLYLTPSS